MKKIAVFLILSVFLTASVALAGDLFPTSLAAFTLGENVSKYKTYCDLEKATPTSDAPFISEMLIKQDSLPGVRGGSLSFGSCQAPDQLLRIKIKFHDRSQKLFQKLLTKYTKEFGKPDNYEGDAFKNVIAWEWIFQNDAGEKVSLLLMWSRDKEIRPGVSIKMTQMSALDREYACFKSQDYRLTKSKDDKSKIQSINDFIPR
ncbi:MAG: hypothetical protein JEY79_15885 [Pseudodesulfovibrio sp.]|nr:hypothetical protein [Pseudodesulfovibrio sp.]